MREMSRRVAGLVSVLGSLGLSILSGCRDDGGSAGVKQTVEVDGSSTVGPIVMAAEEMFRDVNRGVAVPVGVSGTGAGFSKFLDEKPKLRTDITNASRPIKPAEVDRARELGIEFIELPLALDGICVMVHPENTFCDYLTVRELKRIWEPDSRIRNWKDVREGFPDLEMSLFGPGKNDGTFDYFTEAIMGQEDASRGDYQPSENDNMLVLGISGDKGALGYFGYAYYHRNRGKLKAVAIQTDDKRVLPTLETIRSGEYRPLSRPLFIYVNKKSADENPGVPAFVEYVLGNAEKIVEHPRVNYVGLGEETYGHLLKRFRDRVTGSAMAEHAGTETQDLGKLYSTR